MSLLLSMEVQAAQHYWQMKNDNVYDQFFTLNRIAGKSQDDWYTNTIFDSQLFIGNVGAVDTTATTWFGASIAFVYGINMYVCERCCFV